ncbi:LacI family DNA-binding transcriptional regulator [Flintibacter muris]|uniref:LacI family DNA-binding transcriptional regulator n=1 Tax=Flintibacter muris TaxID=2941327 RepID=UPI00204242F4|nr:LacI family DNA-binding transcriptional regulator [Flintibacter muris]
MTIKDIARLSGCGVATVSRVLNDHPDVSEETRRRVLAVVEEQGFQPNNNAKHLKQQAASSIAIVVKGTMNMLFADLVEKIQARLRDAGQDAAVYYLDEDANEVAYALQLNRERRPRGIIFLGGDPELFREGFSPITVPCVLLTNTARELGFKNLSSFTTDDVQAAAEVVRLLAGQGHRNIGLLGGSWSGTQIGYRRLVGCRDACQRLGLPFDEDRQCEPCRYSMPEAYAATRVLLERCPGLTAIFAISDVMAMGAIRALQDMGKQVPRDISVVGYDGITAGQYFLPRLTTVRQDTQQLAERGVEALLRGIVLNSHPVHELVPFQLIEGESVARLS